MANLRERLQRLSTDEAVRVVAELRLQVFRQVAELRETHLKGRHELSDKTRESYAADARRVAAAGGDPATLAGTVASFRKLRAACLWHAREQLAEVLARADRQRKQAGSGLAGDAAALLVYDEQLPPLLDQLTALGQTAFARAGAGRRCRTKRQRHKLGRLPADWIDRINAAARGSDRQGMYRHAVAVASLVPVRPAEVAAHVQVELLAGGGLLFRIQGAKVRPRGAGVAAAVQGIGQPWREVVVHSVDASRQRVLDGLRAEVSAQGGRITVGKGMTAGGISSAFRAMSARTFANYAAPPSFYALRHAACAEFKASGTVQQVAIAMGHQSERSQQAYGTSGQAAGGYVFNAVAGQPARSARARPAVTMRARRTVASPSVPYHGFSLHRPRQ